MVTNLTAQQTSLALHLVDAKLLTAHAAIPLPDEQAD